MRRGGRAPAGGRGSCSGTCPRTRVGSSATRSSVSCSIFAARSPHWPRPVGAAGERAPPRRTSARRSGRDGRCRTRRRCSAAGRSRGPPSRPCGAAPTCRSRRRRGSRPPRSGDRRGSGRSSRSAPPGCAPPAQPFIQMPIDVKWLRSGFGVADALDDRDVALVEAGLELGEATGGGRCRSRSAARSPRGSRARAQLVVARTRRSGRRCSGRRCRRPA